MNKPAVSQARLARAVKAMTKAGLLVSGMRLHPDGSVELLTGVLVLDSSPVKHVNAIDSVIDDWAAKHGHGEKPC